MAKLKCAECGEISHQTDAALKQKYPRAKVGEFVPERCLSCRHEGMEIIQLGDDQVEEG